MSADLSSVSRGRTRVKSIKSLYGAYDMMTGCLARSVLTFLVNDQAFKLSRHDGTRAGPLAAEKEARPVVRVVEQLKLELVALDPPHRQ